MEMLQRNRHRFKGTERNKMQNTFNIETGSEAASFGHTEGNSSTTATDLIISLLCARHIMYSTTTTITKNLILTQKMENIQ